MFRTNDMRYDVLTGREFLDGYSSYSYLFPTREEAENATNEIIAERKLAKYLNGNGQNITEEWPLEQKKSLLKMFEPEVNTE